MGRAQSFQHLLHWAKVCLPLDVATFFAVQRQHCSKILPPSNPEMYAVLALNCNEGSNLPELEVSH